MTMDGLHISTYDAGRHIITLGGGSTTTHAYNIVRGGKIAWSYSDPAAKGEISDAVLLSNGNVLFAHQFGITEITPDKKVVWNYDAPAGYEVHTAVPIGAERVLYIQNPAKSKNSAVRILLRPQIRYCKTDDICYIIPTQKLSAEDQVFIDVCPREGKEPSAKEGSAP